MNATLQFTDTDPEAQEVLYRRAVERALEQDREAVRRGNRLLERQLSEIVKELPRRKRTWFADHCI